MLTVEAAPDSQVTIYNMQGCRMLYTQGQQHIDLSSFAPGIYIVDVDGTKHKIVKI